MTPRKEKRHQETMVSLPQRYATRSTQGCRDCFKTVSALSQI
jgi:hypothetical protein